MGAKKAMARRIEAGIEIRADVAGIGDVNKLANEIEAVGGDASELRARAQALSDTFNELGKKSALINQFREIKTESRDVGSALDEAQNKVRDLAEQMRQNPSADLQSDFEKAVKAAQKLKNKHDELQRQLQQTRTEMNQAGVSTRDLAGQQARLTQDAEAARRDLQELTDEAKKLKAVADDRATLGLDIDDSAEREINEITQAYERLRDGGTLSSTELARATERYEQRLRELRGEAERAPGSINPIAASISQIGKQAMAIAGVTIGLDMIKESITAILDKTQEFQAIRQRLDYAFGSAAEGAKQLDFVRDTTQRLGLEVMGAADGYSQLASATKNLNISSVETQQIFSGVASAAAAMRLSADDANGVFIALSQIAGKGKVSMEELRGQLGERLTPAMAIAADSMGVTTAELEKMVESGISAEDFLPRFGAALEQVFSIDAAKNINSLSGQINLMKNQFNETLNSFGEGGVAGAAISVLDDVRAAMTFLQTQMATMDATLSGGVKDGITATYEGIKEGVTVVAQLFSTVMERINAVGNAFNMLRGEANGDFDLIKSTIDGVNIVIGALRDGIAGIGIALDVMAGTSLKAFSLIAEGLSKITFGELSENFANAAKALDETSKKHFGNAEKSALSFESKTVAAMDKAIESEEQRFRRLETEARQAYTAAAQAAIKAAKEAELAQTDADAAVGTSSTEAATQKARDFDNIATQAQAAALKTETEWKNAFTKIGGSADEVDKITQPMQEAGLTVKTAVQEIEKMSPALKNARSAAVALGLDLRGSLDEPTPAITEMQKKIDKIRLGFTEMGSDGVNAGSIVRGAMEQMLKTATNANDIEIVKENWRSFGRDGAISMRELEEGLVATELRLQEIDDALNPVQASFDKTIGKAKEIPEALIGAKAAAVSMGVDVQAAMNEPTNAMLGLANNADSIRTGFEEMKASGMDAGVVVRGSIEQMLAAAANHADIDVVKAKIREFGRDGSLSMRDVEQGIINANLRLQDLNNTLNPVNAAFEKLGIKTKEALGLAAKDMQASFERVRDSGNATTEGLQEAFKRTADAAIGSGDIQAQSWVRANAAQYGYQLEINNTGKASLKLAEDVKKSNAEQQASTKGTTDTLKQQAGATSSVANATKAAGSAASSYKAITFAMYDKSIVNAEAYKNMIMATRDAMRFHPGGNIIGFFKEYNKYIKAYEDQVRRAVNETANLNQKVENGTVNQKDLAAAIQATNARMGKLDSTTLKNLHDAIDKARQKIKAMRDEAEDTRSSLDAELASLRGDESKREQLEQESKVRELNLKLAEAEKAENRAAIADYRSAIKLQEQIYSEKKKQAELEKERVQLQFEQERIAAEQNAIQATVQAPIEVNIGNATVPVQGTQEMAQQIVNAFKDALSGRDAAIMQQTIEQFMSQIQNEIKRGGL